MSIAGMFGKGLGKGLGYARVGAALVGGLSTNGRTAGGALAGAAYGAFSDNTSVLGGAMMGAGLARYGGAAFKSGRSAMGSGRQMSLPGMGKGVGGVMRAAGRGTYRQAMADAKRSYRTIGQTITKAKGKFGVLKTSTGKGMPTPGQMSFNF